ncbi:LytTR family DNA-binding domain-containing protein [Fulvivirga lutimaris]|uniref:LytTR family DNA-binding domain-containing protein n=1 Tax=Fulvivirga lutimaris TaxID=1819566 RepID=UPI0012BD6479|nr:LytTR family DNA-binding domain-containing protein [Fulvivirga lutimaris]MTI39429.1 LytTR family transcriptional regulator [Fulvivirga lutimaris]
MRIYNEQLGKTREDLHTTKTQRIKERLMASDEFGEVFVEVNKILWIEREDRKTFIHTIEDKYRLKENISEIEAKLNPDRFVRINRSSIINLECLLNYSFWENDKYIVRLKDSDKEFVMSRERLQKIKHLLLEPVEV